MVDWSLTRHVVRFAAGADDPPPDLGADLPGLSAELEGQVSDYTGLEPTSPIPPAQLVGRVEWASLNLDTMADLLDPVAERLDRRLSSAGPLAGALRAATGATLAAEAGLVLGYVSQRVLGQYEVSLLGPQAPARLLYVTPNLDRAVRELDVERQSFLRWIAIHELTHAFEFQGVTWLRPHMAELLRRYLRTVEVRIDSGAAGGLPSLPHPSRLVEAFREGGLAALVQTRQQRRLMGEIQSAMAVVEGYSDHVMDVLGLRLLPRFEGLRAAMERRRRSRSAPERVIERLLGLDLKMRQYELGRHFCESVAARAGIRTLNRVWASPEELPTPEELERPEGWLRRAGRARVAGAGVS